MSASTTAFSPRLLTTPQAAQYLAVSRYKIHQMIVSGELPAVRAFKYRRVDIRDLDNFIERTKQ